MPNWLSKKTNYTSCSYKLAQFDLFSTLTMWEVYGWLDAKLRSDEWKPKKDVAFWAVLPRV